MAERFFGKIASDVEKIATRMEEGISVLTTGELPKQQQQEQQQGGGDEGFGGSEDLADLPDLEGMSEQEIQKLMETEMMQNSPLAGIAESVVGDIIAGQARPETPLEHFHAFRSAVTWKEPFVLSLLAFHVAVFFLCIWASRKGRGATPRLVILASIFVVVRSAERLNGFAAQNWQSFATQDYFDSRGIFIGIMLCGPLIVDCLVMLFMFLREASQLLVQVKKREVAEKRKKKQS